MKPLLAAFAVYCLLVLAGCGSPAVSLRPLYLEKEQPAKQAGLEGEWLSEDQAPASGDAQRLEDQIPADEQSWNVTSDSDGCYNVRMRKQDSDTNKTQVELYKTCLVNLQDRLFFDTKLLTKEFGATSVSPDDLGPSAVQGHLVGRLDLNKDLLLVAHVNSSWVEKNAPEGFRVMQGSSAVITASTEDLRKFLTEHAADDSVWSYAYFCRPKADCKLLATIDRLARNPNDKDVLENAAGFFISRADYERAAGMLRHAIEVAPTDSGPHGLLALALLPKRDFAAVRRELVAAQKLDPENHDAFEFYIGGTYYLEGNFDEASRTFSRLAAPQKPGEAAIILFNYFSLARAGHRKKADAYLSREAARFVGSPEDHLLLLEATGRVKDAPWAKPTPDAKDDQTFLYAENCLFQGDIKAARAALEKIANRADSDIINQVAARVELERLAKN